MRHSARVPCIVRLVMTYFERTSAARKPRLQVAIHFNKEAHVLSEFDFVISEQM